MKTLVLGLGNPILSDDGIGIHVVRGAAARYKSEDAARPENTSQAAGCGEVVFAEASVGGLRLLEVIAGYDRLILVDAIQTQDGAPGTSYHFRLADMRPSLHADSTHDVSFPEALLLGRGLGLRLPADAGISIFAIEAEDVLTFGETLTPQVAAALPQAVDELLAELCGRQTGKVAHETQRSA